jgi:hypothetical protein
MRLSARRSRWWVAGGTGFVLISSLSFGASERDGKREKSEIATTLPQPSGTPDTYEIFSPYWTTNLTVGEEAIQAHLNSLEEKEFPNARNATQEILSTTHLSTN